MLIEIRHPREDELPAFIDARSTAFLERPDVDKVAAEVRPLWDLNRLWAAFDGGHMCATFRSWPTELTVPGDERLPASAITNVTVLPTHRRRGMLRSMMAAEHDAIRERGEVLGLLRSAEYPIYGRFGYGPGCLSATWTLNTRVTAFHGNPTGSVELVPPSEDVRDAMKGVFDAARLRQPGEIRRRDYGWDFDLGLREMVWHPRWKGFLVLRRDAAGTVDGYVRYRAEEKWDQGQPRGIITVDDLQASSDDAYAALWQFLGNVDLVTTVKAENRDPRERLPWRNAHSRTPGPPSRRTSLTACGSGCSMSPAPSRAAPTSGRRALSSSSSTRMARMPPGGRLRLHLDASPSGATCRPPDRPPDLTLHVGALSAAYLGGTRLRDAVLATGVDEHSPGALTTADRLLKTHDEPWCSTFF